MEDNIEAVDPPVGVGSRVAVHTPHMQEAVVPVGNMLEAVVAVGGSHLGVDKHKADKALAYSVGLDRAKGPDQEGLLGVPHRRVDTPQPGVHLGVLQHKD